MRCSKARERGVLFDIAHGMGAFGYDSAEAALQDGFKPDLISSDVHVIAVEGPGYDLLHTMSKLLNCGLSLPEVIGMSTSRPALAIRRPELGHLGVGAVGRYHGAQAVRQRLRVRGRGRQTPPGSQPAARRWRCTWAASRWKSAAGPSRRAFSLAAIMGMSIGVR